MPKQIHCDQGDYDARIYSTENPYGVHESIAVHCMEMHEQAFKGHKCEIRNIP